MRGTLARTTSALEDHKKSCLDPDHRPESDLTVSSSTIEKMFEITFFSKIGTEFTFFAKIGM